MPINLQNKTAWVFDLDGTLTNPVHDFAHMRRVLGMPENADILHTLAQTQGELKQQLTQKLDELDAFYAAKATPALGVVELIAKLAARGCKLGIFTRNTQEMALLSLESIGIDQYFTSKVVIGRDEAPAKPDPQGLLEMLKRWKAPIDGAVMVGDYKFDLEAGRQAGAVTVHVASGQERWPELTDYHYLNLADLNKVL
jgi:HAD superfamily hydrolase (TIGR01549 family)